MLSFQKFMICGLVLYTIVFIFLFIKHPTLMSFLSLLFFRVR